MAFPPSADSLNNKRVVIVLQRYRVHYNIRFYYKLSFERYATEIGQQCQILGNAFSIGNEPKIGSAP